MTVNLIINILLKVTTTQLIQIAVIKAKFCTHSFPILRECSWARIIVMIPLSQQVVYNSDHVTGKVISTPYNPIMSMI